MKRHKSLHPLSHHHHHVLVRALEIRRADQLPSLARDTAMKKAARDLLRFYQETGKAHFREEEEILLPACARLVRIDQEPAIVRMLAEHALIRARLQDLEAALAEKAPVEALVTELGQRLNDHVRFEEEVLFPRVEELLGEAGLAAVAPHLTPMHGQSCDTDS